MGLGSKIKKAVKKVGHAVESVGKSVADKVKDPKKLAVTAAAAVASYFAGPAGYAAVSGLGNAYINKTESAKAQKKIQEQFAQAYLGGSGSMFEGLGDWLSNSWSATSNWFSEASNSLSDWFYSSPLADYTDEFGNTTPGWLSSLGDGLGFVGSLFGNSAGSLFSGLGTGAGALASGIGGLFSSGLGSALGSVASSALDYENTRKMLHEQMDFQKEMSNTSMQRAVADLEKAGLNPLLALPGGASTPAGSSAPMNQASTAYQNWLQKQINDATVENLRAQNSNIRAQNAEIGARTDLIKEQTRGAHITNNGNQPVSDMKIGAWNWVKDKVKRDITTYNSHSREMYKGVNRGDLNSALQLLNGD